MRPPARGHPQRPSRPAAASSRCLRRSVPAGIWESTNDDYHHRLREWERGGKQGRKPWFRWLWFTPTNVRFWGAWIYMCGCIAYLVAASALVWQTVRGRRAACAAERGASC